MFEFIMMYFVILGHFRLSKQDNNVHREQNALLQNLNPTANIQHIYNDILKGLSLLEDDLQ